MLAGDGAAAIWWQVGAVRAEVRVDRRELGGPVLVEIEPGVALAAPDFGRLIALERRAGRRYGIVTVLLLLGGLVVAAGGLVFGQGAPVLFVAPGLLAAALALLPWREALERRDRVGGLEVLAEEWAELAPEDAAAPARLLALMEAMFGRSPLERAGARA